MVAARQLSWRCSSAAAPRHSGKGAAQAYVAVGLMAPKRSQRATSTSWRDCPVCGEPVHWSRHWLRASTWARWPCRRCGSLLGFDRKNRWRVAAPIFALVGFLAYFGSLGATWGLLPLLGVAIAVVALLDRVTVVGHRSKRYCHRCRYDLVGTLVAGIKRCPECGTTNLDLVSGARPSGAGVLHVTAPDAWFVASEAERTAALNEAYTQWRTIFRRERPLAVYVLDAEGKPIMGQVGRRQVVHFSGDGVEEGS